MSKYTSFLICFHEKHTDIYRDGLPLGAVKEGLFEAHQHILADGSKRPVARDASLLEHVQDVVALMQRKND